MPLAGSGDDCRKGTANASVLTKEIAATDDVTGPGKRGGDSSLVIATAKVLPSRGERSLEACLPTARYEVG